VSSSEPARSSPAAGPGATPCSTRELLGFALAAAVIALHVVAESFVALEPGIARGEHVLSVTVPLALAAIAVLLYPRLRPGLRGTYS
jgi:hypothetical protein